ncbi:DUF6538 domain-containing protein [Vibrio vulnificus]|uniref:DUF6538 domain-containing protein n=1 Tax=Vibrio vulnificus TaxID=672 RepID=UPI003EDB4B5D
MYLIKLSNNVFYTRISTPVALQTSLGYPREIRLSLLTKHRRLASKRNSQLSGVINTLYEQALTERIPYASFKMDLDAKVAKVRQQFTSNLPNVDNLQSNYTVVNTPSGNDASLMLCCIVETTKANCLIYDQAHEEGHEF